ncbi:hypothetical protein [Marinobacter sp. LV10R510-11A]|uniref:hypothetical protein n=1 Tax=Marinobacter sp. LV10R510-11A TaxID=1415568 RepID=UPI001D0D136E|nr:hypothetical protein [Marinobacter sp. LV10R510-11A]
MGALARAHQLFQDQSRWLARHHRIEILERAVALMPERVESLTQTALPSPPENPLVWWCPSVRLTIP